LPIILGVILLFTSKASFIGNWNALAKQYGSLDYNSFTSAVGKTAGPAMPTTWNWGDTLGGMVALMVLFIYLYTVAYVGGEVKRPEKSILQANFLIIMVPAAIAALCFVGLYKMLDFNFLSAAGYNNLNGPIDGYTMPWPSSFMTLVFVAAGGNRFVGLLAALSFGAANWLLIGIDFILMQRAMFAWGMDRRGPKWFTSINARYASPIGMYMILGTICIACTAWYVYSGGSSLTGLVGAGLQLVSVFLITGISALIFAYRKKVRSIWDSSPFRTWKLAGIPVVSVAAVFYLVYLGMDFYFAFIGPKTKDVTGKNLIFFAVAWAVGIAWYFAWRQRSIAAGIDPSLAYGELPPE
jgi:basic amino acid/polyamine antiporter, APA family